MPKKDYYQTLQVSRNATAEEIKKSYRKLAAQYHPDRNPDNKAAEDHFKEIAEAYHVLGDLGRKRRYDLLGENWKSFEVPNFTEVTLTDIIDSLRNGFKGVADNVSGFFQQILGLDTTENNIVDKDIQQVTLVISLEEAYQGCEKMLDVFNEVLRIKLKKGILDEHLLRLKAKGKDLMNGNRGDLLVKINVAPHKKFTVDGTQIHTELAIKLTTAVLGGVVSVPTLSGEVPLTIPAGTPNTKTLILNGLGMPSYEQDGTQGDLYIRIYVLIPTKLSPAERSVYEKLASLGF